MSTVGVGFLVLPQIFPIQPRPSPVGTEAVAEAAKRSKPGRSGVPAARPEVRSHQPAEQGWLPVRAESLLLEQDKASPSSLPVTDWPLVGVTERQPAQGLSDESKVERVNLLAGSRPFLRGAAPVLTVVRVGGSSPVI